MVVVVRVRVTRTRRRVCILDGTEETDGACCASGGDANCRRHLVLLSVLEVKWDQQRSARVWKGLAISSRNKD